VLADAVAASLVTACRGLDEEREVAMKTRSEVSLGRSL